MKKKIFLILLLLIPVISHAQPYLDQGLVAAWPFNGNANDYSGNGYNGTAVGVWPVNDRNGVANHAYYFDGIASKIFVAQDKFVSSLLTVSFFIMITESVVYNYAMACSDFIIFTEYDSVGITISLPAQKSAWGYAELDKWTHVVGTYDNNDIRLYINGLIADSVYHPGIIFDMNWDMVMGGFGTNYWEGELDDIRIYDRVLSPVEVGQLFDYYGIEDRDASEKPAVWPQPASNLLSVRTGIGEITSFSIFTADGRCVLQGNETGTLGEKQISIDVSHLPCGIYVLKVVAGGTTSAVKVMISR